ncbi:MAG TPA: ribosomal RNA small subunit methyltransferase A [Calditrichaeota bacterium]|nr:ribosomal RNA small subunit methyltransferase A [Calditrichota bacterium]
MSRPLKRFGQNFLTNTHYQQQIVEALDIASNDVVIEVGPGHGALSEIILTKKPAKFIAVEIDRNLTRKLEARYGSRIQLLNKDFLEIDLTELLAGRRPENKIVGNIPYNITSPILFKLLDHYTLLCRAVLMVQKEVAKRIAAAPNCKDYGILSVISQIYAQVDYLFDVGRGNFYPVPKVDSAVIRLNFFEKTEGIDDEALFRKIVRHTFNYRRKMLRNSLGRILDKTIVYSLESIALEQRPENLSVQQFKALANEIHSKTKTVL